jgi:uncharacterized protein YecA (UPF0149 family)
MKIKRINLSTLRNEEWFNFITEFKKFVEGVSPEKLNIEKLFAVFLGFYTTVDAIIEKIRKSGITNHISQLDKQRDITFRGLIYIIKAYKCHFDIVKRDAAKSLEPLIKHYGNLAIKPYNEETAGIYNFLQEFRGKYKDVIDMLELTDWLDALDNYNQIFEDAILERNSEGAKKTDLQLFSVRRKTNRSYLNIVERLEALILLEEDEGEMEKYISFVKTLNTNVKRYLDILAQRKGRSDAKKDNNKYDEED